MASCEGLFMKFIRFILVIAISFFSAASYGAEKLNILTSLDPIEAAEYINAFEKETGVKTQWIRLSAGEALARLKSESGHPTQDVWFGGPVFEYIAARGYDLLEQHVSQATKKVPLKWRDPDGYWTGIYLGTIAFISGKGVRPPVSWQDLLNPEYKGEIVVSYPYTAGTGFTVLAGLVAIMGDDGAIDYYKKLDNNIRRYTKSGFAPIMEVGLGEAGVGIVFSQDALRKGKSRGFPVTITYPSDGIPYEIGGVAIIRGGDRELAGRFIDWLVSASTQNTLHKYYRIPVLPDAVRDVGLPIPEASALAKMNFYKMGKQREELIQRWREKVGK